MGLTQGTPIIFFGNERLATGIDTTAPTLTALLEAGYDVKAVVSNYEPGTSRKVRELEIQAVAREHNIPVLLPLKLADIAQQLQDYQADIAVLVAYGRMVPQSIIDIFPKGIVNIHPSLLPLHRGPIPIESVILHGDTKTGVSVMSLVKAMDAGPVYGQSEAPLTGSETKQELADHLLNIGGAMVVELLPGILEGAIVALPQDDSLATYDNLIAKDDGTVDWQKPAEQLEREVRAYTGWPRSRTTLAGKEVVITAAKVVDQSGKPGEVTMYDKNILVYTGNEALLIQKLIPAGKKEMTAQAFLAGNKI